MNETRRPQRILLTTVGSSGDVHPFVAIALALRERGHDVTMVVNPYFESTVRGVGLEFLPLGPHVSPTDIAKDTPSAFGRYTGTYVVMRRLFMDSLRDTYPSLREAIERVRPDVVVGHQFCYALPWLVREFNARWVTCVLSPAPLLSDHDPAVYPFGLDVRRAPMWLRRFQHANARRAMGMLVDGPINKFRKEIGIAPARDHTFTEMFKADRILAMFSPEFRALAPDDPPRMEVCGFPWFERHGHHGELAETLTPELEAFLDAGTPPVVFSLGSVLSHTGARMFRAALEATRSIGQRAVLVTGHDHGGELDLGDSAIRVDYAPYSLLMRRAAVNVHHAGIGTTAQALRAGRPMVAVPHAHDQFDNAARVEAKQAGLSIPAKRAYSPERLARVLRRALEDPSIADQASRLGAIVENEDGAGVAATAIEHLADTPREDAPDGPSGR